LASPGIAATIVSFHPDVPEVDDGLVSNADQRNQATVSQQQDVFEDTVGQSQIFRAVAVMPGHIHEMQQIERCFYMAARKTSLRSASCVPRAAARCQ
jgi:hypothetical protein